MEYIKGKEIINSSVYTTVEGIQLELTDSQLRTMGYVPVDEVVMQQAESLMNLVPTEEDIKTSLIDSMEVVFPQGGLPYKLGYTWVAEVVGNNIVFESVRDANGLGTNNNPIIFVQYVQLIPNAFYLHDGNEYVYVGKKGTAESWESVAADMELM